MSFDDDYHEDDHDDDDDDDDDEEEEEDDNSDDDCKDDEDDEDDDGELETQSPLHSAKALLTAVIRCRRLTLIAMRAEKTRQFQQKKPWYVTRWQGGHGKMGISFLGDLLAFFGIVVWLLLSIGNRCVYWEG